jgi:hypothetical protein
MCGTHYARILYDLGGFFCETAFFFIPWVIPEPQREIAATGRIPERSGPHRQFFKNVIEILDSAA